MNRMIKSLAVAYLLFPFTFMQYHSLQKGIYYLIIILALIDLFYKVSKTTIKKSTFDYYFCFIFLFVILLFLTIIIPVFKHTYDTSYLSRLIDYLMKFFILSIICLISTDVNDFINTYVIATAIYVFFSIILLVPSFRLFYSQIMYSTEEKGNHAAFLAAQGLLYYTRFGLQGFSGFEHTFKCSLAFIFILYEFSCPHEKKLHFRYVFLAVINFIGCCFYGRIGILSCILSFSLYCLYSIVFRRNHKLLFLIFIIFFFSIFLFISLIDVIKANPITNWMFEPFIKLYETGKFQSASSDGLKTMYVKPTIDTFLFGDGYYEPNGRYYKGTDVGLLRPLLFWGIFGSIIYYLCFFVLLLPIYNELKDKNGRLLVLLFIIQNVLFEMKGEINLVFISILYIMNIILITRNIKHKSIYRIKNSRVSSR